MSIVLTALFASQAFAQSAISQSNWTLHYVDSEDVEAGYYAAVNAFDGDPNTIWVTQWYTASPPPPHDIRINLGAAYDISGFRYLPRQDGWSSGNIAQYAFYVSTDGTSWGTAVATGTFSQTSGEQQVLFTMKRGQYIRLRALTEVQGRPWTAVAELNVLAAGGAPGGMSPPSVLSGKTIPRSSWTVQSVDSQETAAGNYRATLAFDGNPSSMWATEWSASSPPPPHDLRINLGNRYDISGFRYLPRQDGETSGNIGQYQFYVSTDGSNWGTAVASGTFANSAAEQQVTFSPKNGQFIRLRVLSEVNGSPWTTVAELNVLTSSSSSPSSPPSGGGSSNFAPFVSLSDSGGGGPYQAPATFSLVATTSDVDGSVTRVDFYRGSTLIKADGGAPFSASVQSLSAGTYSFYAVALDNAGGSTTSDALVVTVGNLGSGITRRAVFSPSADHDTLVSHYVLEIFPLGANVSAANPVGAVDLGKPGVVNGECQVDITGLFTSLSPGTYVATVTAVGNGESERSAPSPAFNR